MNLHYPLLQCLGMTIGIYILRTQGTYIHFFQTEMQKH